MTTARGAPSGPTRGSPVAFATDSKGGVRGRRRICDAPEGKGCSKIKHFENCLAEISKLAQSWKN